VRYDIVDTYPAVYWITKTKHPCINLAKLKIYTIDGASNAAKNECNAIIIAPRRHKHPSSGANRPSNVSVTVNIIAELNLSVI